ncbi:hypothetical protein BGZ57DRAFT_936704 [Hyaloscypha finlandica]|nr:hypothetical protein BGZ57DRAFT_936704 [Hyaloscypha finlandica]
MSTTTMAQTGTFTDLERNGNSAQIQAVDSLSMAPAVFEKLLLSPQAGVKYDLRRTFAIPTSFPLHSFRVLVGFGIVLRPLFCCLMGWRGSNQQKMGSADMQDHLQVTGVQNDGFKGGAYMWFGGLTD